MAKKTTKSGMTSRAGERTGKAGKPIAKTSTTSGGGLRTGVSHGAPGSTKMGPSR